MKKLMLLLCLFFSISVFAQPPGYVRGTQVCWNFNGRDHGYFKAAGNGERHILLVFTAANETNCTNMNTNAPQKWLGTPSWNGKTVRAAGDTIIWEILTIANTNNNFMGAYASDINYFFANIAAIDTGQHRLFHAVAIAHGVNRMWGYLTNAQTHNSPYRNIFSTTISVSTGYLGSTSLFPGIKAYSPGRRHWVWYGTADATSAPNASIQLYDSLQGTKNLTAQTGGTHGAITWDSCFSTRGSDANSNRWKWMVSEAPPVQGGPPGYVPGTHACWTFNGRQHGYFRAAGNGERHILVSMLGVQETSCSDMNVTAPQKWLGSSWNGKTVRAPGDTIVWEILTLPHNSGFSTAAYADDIEFFFENIAPIDTGDHRRFHIEGLSAGAHNIWRYLGNNNNHNSPYRHIFSTSITMSVPWLSETVYAGVTSGSHGRRNWVWHGANDDHELCPPRAADTLYKYMRGVKRFTMQQGSNAKHNNIVWDSCMSIKGSDTNTNRWKWMVIFPTNFPTVARPGNNAAIEEMITAPEKLTIYPNPAANNIMISWDLPAASYRITVTDAMGRLHKVIQNVRQRQYDLDISSLQKGVYIIHIDAGGRKLQKKIIKE